jgi:hypothetical protein
MRHVETNWISKIYVFFLTFRNIGADVPAAPSLGLMVRSLRNAKHSQPEELQVLGEYGIGNIMTPPCLSCEGWQ